MVNNQVSGMGQTRCPICHSLISTLPYDQENFIFLKQLETQGVLDDYLKICRVYLDILHQGASTTAIITKAVSTIKSEVNKVTNDELNKTSTNIVVKLQETLRSQIPDPKSIEVIIKTLPELTLAIHELLKKQYIPLEKGTEAEKTLRDELASYFPEDEVIHLGGSGQTDIIIQPRINGTSLREPIIVESKSNKNWDRSYYSDVRKHMQFKQCRSRAPYGSMAQARISWISCRLAPQIKIGSHTATRSTSSDCEIFEEA